MKQIMLLLGLLAFLTLQAQKKNIQLYGFSQGVSKGIRNTSVDEKGEMNTEKKSNSKKLLLFLEFPEGSTLKITELWINGEKFHFQISPEKKNVILNTGLRMPGQQETVLVPETINTVTRLIPLTKIDVTETHVRKIAQRKPVVVFFTINGKTCNRSLDKLEEVPEMVME
jgi:hypothetical protein